jgi:amino acid adenylation domain-containing protein
MNLATSFLDSVIKYPQRPALVVRDATYSYEQLHAAASAIASAVIASRPDAAANPPVAVITDRTAAPYQGILGALLAGSAYVPLGSYAPPERNARILALSGADVLVTGEHTLAYARDIASRIDRPITLILPIGSALPSSDAGSTGARCRVAELGTAMTSPPASASDLAYVMFTSGTTGTPKGVMVSHDSVSDYVQTVSRWFQPNEHDRFSQASNLTFDLSAHDMNVCWHAGAALHVVPEDAVMTPAKFIRSAEITFWLSVPSVGVMMSKLGMLKANAFPSLRVTLFCGEALPLATAAAWQRAAPTSIIENFYGPTEATIAITTHRFHDGVANDTGVVPIGRAFDGQATAVVDDQLRAVPAGQPGELCLSGSQLARGYWADATTTAAKFLALPDLGGRWYRTGDLVREDPVHGLMFLGRIDHQVKIRGHRVELSEIEHQLRVAMGTDDVAAIGWPVSVAGAEGIIAFASGTSVSQDEVLAHCRRTLAPVMVPNEIHVLARLPTNDNGKIDRRELRRIREQELV